ncbi:sulfite reductase (NADPH) hemoprotein beta-component [Methylomagnum ishizawai]|uniref:Sulfite reductase (NADPH) hemoprotein beta-component n=1 Tax=Methylomagnum ishizawai TaxID=1760988 RepID=A0A1Y6D263_9GAMM|nr:nitrite/sulfite reductase [Methylomagnum ishizawai]SMF96701.1 sulfite reductase (NADPH) hemoprotein beta-component [Methylomagnum ishizawai]
MYHYDNYDQTLVDERVAQFKGQTERFLAGELTEEQFRPLRLMNGLYIQRHAPMLRVAIPYGLLSSRQLRMLAQIARRYDQGYGHFTTRQNIQYNWPKLEEVPEILEQLATVEMHAIQTSGNCIRNTTSDHLAGVAQDELEDPRPYCEIIRQWSTLHPEFAFLPRKFKIAVSGAQKDRAATQVHDIGLQLVKGDDGETGFEVLVGGGLGRTPIIGVMIRPFLEKRHLLSYLEAILRVYNRYGRRDNKYKARIKILVKELGQDQFAERVEAEWAMIRDQLLLDQAEINRVQAFFQPHPYAELPAEDAILAAHKQCDAAFAAWFRHNSVAHKVPGYRVAFVSLKPLGIAPGDMTDRQMDAVADLAERYSFGEIRVTHTQNLVLADVRQSDLYELWQALTALDLATPNIGTASDIISCPGLDFCSLANATSIPIANGIQQIFDSLDYLYDLGDLRINISGCMNGCGHHTVGHIGILGVDKKGEEWYQITLGGSSANQASLGERLGPAIAKEDVIHAMEAIFQTYREQRLDDEAFLETVRRVGIEPFQERVYGDH